MSPPQIICLAVLRYPDGWRIVAGEGRWGRFAYRVDAEEAALRLAAKLAAEGRRVQVLSQDLGHMEVLRAAS